MTRRKLLEALLLERNAPPPPPPVPASSPSAEWEQIRRRRAVYVLLHDCGVPTTEIAEFYGVAWESVVSAVEEVLSSVESGGGDVRR